MALKRLRRVLRYTDVPECHACGESGTVIDHLNRGIYRFGPFDVPYPKGGRVPLKRCRDCGVVYKELVPEPFALQDLYADTASPAREPHGHNDDTDREFLARFIGERPSYDVLDIGSAKGGLQSVEDPLAGWSGRPYDVVLAVDIFQRLYHPKRALANLASLTRPEGILVAQTGTARYVRPPSRFRDWWYLNRLEHHMAWTPQALARAAEPLGFLLEHVQVGCHEDASNMPGWLRAGFRALRALAGVNIADSVLLALTSYDPNLVGEPGAPDHFTAVLRRHRTAEDVEESERLELARYLT